MCTFWNKTASLCLWATASSRNYLLGSHSSYPGNRSPCAATISSARKVVALAQIEVTEQTAAVAVWTNVAAVWDGIATVQADAVLLQPMC